MSIKVKFTIERETKNKIRYKEDGEDAVIGTLYVAKSVVEQQELGDRVVVTLDKDKSNG